MKNELLEGLLEFRGDLFAQIYDTWVEIEELKKQGDVSEDYDLYKSITHMQYRYRGLTSMLAWVEMTIETEEIKGLLHKMKKS